MPADFTKPRPDITYLRRRVKPESTKAPVANPSAATTTPGPSLSLARPQSQTAPSVTPPAPVATSQAAPSSSPSGRTSLSLARSNGAQAAPVAPKKVAPAKPLLTTSATLSLENPVVRLNARQSAIGSLSVSGATIFGWRTRDGKSGIKSAKGVTANPKNFGFDTPLAPPTLDDKRYFMQLNSSLVVTPNNTGESEEAVAEGLLSLASLVEHYGPSTAVDIAYRQATDPVARALFEKITYQLPRVHALSNAIALNSYVPRAAQLVISGAEKAGMLEKGLEIAAEIVSGRSKLDNELKLILDFDAPVAKLFRRRIEQGDTPSASDTKSENEVVRYGNRPVAEFVESEIVIGLRHIHKVHSIALTAQSGVVTITLLDGATVKVDTLGGTFAAYLSVVDNVIEIRAEGLFGTLDQTFHFTNQ